MADEPKVTITDETDAKSPVEELLDDLLAAKEAYFRAVIQASNWFVDQALLDAPDDADLDQVFEKQTAWLEDPKNRSMVEDAIDQRLDQERDRIIAEEQQKRQQYWAKLTKEAQAAVAKDQAADNGQKS